MICTHPAAEYAKRMNCVPCEICKGHVDNRGVVLNKETALQRFPEDRANIESNELRWHPANQAAPARPKSVVAITVAIVLVVVILIVVFGSSGTSTTPTPQTPIPVEQHHITPSEEQAIEQNERESKAGNPQSHAIEREVQEEKQNAHKFAEEMENK